MTAQAIERAHWQIYCETISRLLPVLDVEIEVASPELGHQIEQEWHPWIGISYDPEDDAFDVAVQSDGGMLEHMVRHPQDLFAEMDDANVRALRITDEDGVCHILRLRDGLALPAPAA